MIARCLLTCLLLVGLARSAAAGERWWCWGYAPLDAVGKVCCDDYVAKPLPCRNAALCYECPDYCRKPLPCVQGVNGWQCDDYIRKCLPWLRPPACTHLKCGN